MAITLYFILAVGIGICVLGFWNLRLNRKAARKLDARLEPDHYYELKYKLEYVVTFAITIFGLIGFYGYKSMSDIDDSIKKKEAELVVLYDEKKSLIDKVIVATADSAKSRMNKVLDSFNVVNNQKLRAWSANRDNKTAGERFPIDGIHLNDLKNYGSFVMVNYWFVSFDTLFTKFYGKKPKINKPPLVQFKMDDTADSTRTSVVGVTTTGFQFNASRIVRKGEYSGASYGDLYVRDNPRVYFTITLQK